VKDDRPYLADIVQALHRVWALMERRVGQLHDDVARLVAALNVAS
jgi:hypothetical protein